ncbi:class I adenylate-forming enzyme family protein [Arvimicrobium flavum]|uniref:class I adenylate-forming enzyme family protein n=1 Tax=Arvimicrobium flavum TaxID=3393320 RepID=UPI00237C0B02|nr:class I adenylate-forming enzyme family protein [Mesorhizobium shangrilense]
MRIETFLRQSAAADPGKAAIVAGATRLTYAELDETSDHLAAVLHERGVRDGERAVILMENIWEAAVAIFAVVKAGAVFCPVNPTTKAEALRFILGNCEPKAVLTQGKYAGLLAEATPASSSALLVICAQGAPTPDGLAFEDCIRHQTRLPPAGGADADLAMIIHTSGSTGEPKGVMMSHASMDAASSAIAAYLQNTDDDVVLNALPLSFTYGLYQLLVGVRVGATMVLEKSFAFAYAVLERARAEGVTGLPLVPTMAAMILAMRDAVELPTLRYITNAAAPLPPAHVKELRSRFPDAQLYSMYGLTECARATYLPPKELDRRPESVGKAIPGTEAFVVDEAGRPAAPGAVGELIVVGPHVMQGYWRNGAATAAAIAPGRRPGERRLRTGDLFRADADGFLHFVGRNDDILKIRGEKVAPLQVESVLHACPGVTEAMVIGLPDPVLGTMLHAMVVAADPALTERAVLRHCRELLPDVMVPRSVEFRAELPKTMSGKVIRRQTTATGE